MAAAGAQAPDVRDLLALAIADPPAAEVLADDLIASGTDPTILSAARQAKGVVLRDRGLLDLAVRELRRATNLADRSRDPARRADAGAALGVTLVMAGRTAEGLRQLERAAATPSDPATHAKVLMRRGHVNYFFLARNREALADLRIALPGFRGAGERVWEARTLNLMGLASLTLGRVDDASSQLRQAEEIFVAEGQAIESVITMHNRGMVAFCRGDLPQALHTLDEAAEGYAALGLDEPLFVMDRSDTLLAAGLAADAVTLVGARLHKGALSAAQRADLLLSLASAELAGGDEGSSFASAQRALVLFRRQLREWDALRAELAVLSAGQRRGRRLVASASDVAARLEAGGSDQAAAAWLLAGRAAMGVDPDTAAELLGHAARYRRRTGLVRATGWQARLWRARYATSQGRCSPPAGVAWPLWTSIAHPWGARSCGRWSPAAATSWRPSRCVRRSTVALARRRSGASVGARTRCPSRRPFAGRRGRPGDLAALRAT